MENTQFEFVPFYGTAACDLKSDILYLFFSSDFLIHTPSLLQSLLGIYLGSSQSCAIIAAHLDSPGDASPLKFLGRQSWLEFGLIWFHVNLTETNATPLTESRKSFQQTAATGQGQVVEGISAGHFVKDATLAKILSVSEEQVTQQ